MNNFIMMGVVKARWAGPHRVKPSLICCTKWGRGLAGGGGAAARGIARCVLGGLF